MLVQGIESGEGIFQFVSPLAHARSVADAQTLHRLPPSQETPLIDQLLQTMELARGASPPDTPPGCLIAGRFKISVVMQEHTKDSRSLVIDAEDIQNQSVRRIRLSQIALPFADRVLSPASIVRAKAYLDEHLLAVRQSFDQPLNKLDYPVIASYAGHGRNAVLITYNELCERIRDGQVTRSTLDEALRQAIEKGRQVRSPHYVHSPQQESALKNALLQCLEEQEERLAPHVISAPDPAHNLSTPIKTLGTVHWKVQRLGSQALPMAPRYDAGLSSRRLSGDPIEHQLPPAASADHCPVPADHRWQQAQYAAQNLEQVTTPARLFPDLFPCPTASQPRVHRLSLQGFVHAVEQRLRGPSCPTPSLSTNHGPKPLSSIDASVLGSALSAVCGQDLGRAWQAFDHLARMDLPKALQGVYEYVQKAPYDADTPLISQAAEDAWRTLMALGNTPSELRMLKHLLGTDVPPEQRQMLTTCLKAAQALSAGLHGIGHAEPSLMSPILLNAIANRSTPGSAALNGCLRNLAGLPNTDQDQIAITAFRNHLTDSPDNDFLQTVTHRLSKCKAWVERLENRRGWIKASLKPTGHKSPLQAIELGLQGADLSDIDKRKAQYLEHLRLAQQLCTERLEQQDLAQHVNPEHFKRFKKWARSQPNRSEIEPHLQRMSDALYGRSFKLEATSIQSICSGLAQLIEQMGSDARIRLYDGGIIGAVTGGLTGAVGFATTLFARPRLDCRYAKVRLATIEVAKTSDFLELVLGSVHKTQKRVSAGVAVGHKISGLINISTGVDVIFKDWGSQYIDGICLQIPISAQRPKAQAEQAFIRLINNLFLGLSTTDASHTLNALLLQHHHDDLSISVLDTSKDAHSQRGVVADATASIGNAFAKMGLSLEARVMRQQSQREQQQLSGERRVHKKVSGRFLKFEAGGRANVKFGEALNAGFNPGYGTVDGIGLIAELARAGSAMRWESRDKNATMKKTFYEREFIALEDFVNALNTHRHDWTDTLARTNPGAGPHEIEAFLRKAAACEGAGHTFAMRFEMYKDIRTRLNALGSIIGLLNHRSASQGLLAIRESLQQRHLGVINDPLSYQPASLRVYSKSEFTREQGITLGLVAARRQTVEAVHIPASMSVSKK